MQLPNTPSAPTNILSFFDYVPNQQQKAALLELESFVDPATPDDFFVLKGAAGTGKTSLMQALTAYLASKGISFQVMAPTGRAAKIIGGKTRTAARTIHSAIYVPVVNKEKGTIRLMNKENEAKDYHIFIVDEASMVSSILSNEGSFKSERPVLLDLLIYIKQGNPLNKILLVGDRFQLPPVKEDFSAALSEEYLHKTYEAVGRAFELTEVMRQAEDSPILSLATRIREHMQEGKPFSDHLTDDAHTFYSVHAAVQKYFSLFDPEQPEKVVMLAHTNQTVNRLNTEARKMRFPQLGKLHEGDVVMVNATAYGNGQMLVKGEIGTVVELYKFEEIEGLHFAEAKLQFPGADGAPNFLTAKVQLDCLHNEKGTLSQEQDFALFAHRMRYNDQFRQTKDPRNDAYMSALQLRFAYALTVHKAQGGEWDVAILANIFARHQPQLAYTAVTRARQELYYAMVKKEKDEMVK